MAQYKLNDPFSKSIRGGVNKALTGIGNGIYKAFPNQKGTLDAMAKFGSSNPMKALQNKLGIKGKRKPGDMIAKMNSMKHKATPMDAMKCKSCGAMYKSSEAMKMHMKTHSKKVSDNDADDKMKTKGIKKTGESFGKSNKLGGGGRFRQVEHAVAGKKGVYNPAGLAAYIGRKSLGAKKFQKLAAKGKKN